MLAPRWLTGPMHVARIGLTPLKGARHADLAEVHLSPTGPVGDRVFCLVDEHDDRVLRTVDHPRLVLVDATWDGTVLTVGSPGLGPVSAPVAATGVHLTPDYWGRAADLELVDGPHADLLGAHLGHPVRLARIRRPGQVVYGAPVSLVATGELAELGECDDRRFRATLTVDAEQVPTPGSLVTIGEATIRVRSAIPRCRLIDVDPDTGDLDRRLLARLVDRPRRTGELPFGVDADVITPGTVRPGDPVTLAG